MSERATLPDTLRNALDGLIQAIGYAQSNVAATCAKGHDMTPPQRLLDALAALETALAALVRDRERLDELSNCASLTIEARNGDEASWGNLGIAAAPMRLRAFLDNVRSRARAPHPEPAPDAA